MFTSVLCLASTWIVNRVPTGLYELENFLNPWLS